MSRLINNIEEHRLDLSDFFGKETSQLKDKRLFLFDMDGTIYKDGNLFSGTIPLLTKIKEIGGRVVFITNNSSKSVKDYMIHLHYMGIKASKDEFFTSAQAAILLLQNEYVGRKVFCMGTESLVQELKDSHIDVTTEIDKEATIVLVGYDTELNYSKLRKTCEMLNYNVTYMATNPDWACPSEFGFVPDCGAICKMLECATNKWPEFIGKPRPIMVDFICKKFAIPKEQAVVIGDRLYTDIATGINAGITAVCVLTGEATAKDIETSDIKPTYTFESVSNIYHCLCNLHRL